MEILRFGPGFRRLVTLPGATGLSEQTVWSDPRARITELAFASRALLPPQASPHEGLFVVVAGGGWVQVGDERSAINHGEAVVWPPGLAHGAWTDGSPMRALLVEVPDVATPGAAVRAGEAGQARAEPARGRLAEPPPRPEDHDASEGEPW